MPTLVLLAISICISIALHREITISTLGERSVIIHCTFLATWNIFLIKDFFVLLQDGAVKGPVFISSYKSTKIATYCWTTTNRRILEPIKKKKKKDTLFPKTMKKPQQDDGRRCTIMIKSNPIPTRLVTYKLENNNNKEVLPLLWMFWIPQFPSLGSWQRDWESPWNLTLKDIGIWLQNFYRTGGNRDSTLGGHKQIIARTKTQRKGTVAPQETEQDLPASVGGFLMEVCIHLTAGKGALAAAILEGAPLA